MINISIIGTRVKCDDLNETNSEDNCCWINQQLADHGLFGGARREVHLDQNSSWRISPEPFWLDAKTYEDLVGLGNSLFEFYHACRRLYQSGAKGKQPAWVLEYLHAGKPEEVIKLGQLKRYRNDIPLIIRPDVLLTDEGYAVTELDSVPGGFGLLGSLSQIYSDLGYNLPAGASGIVESFARSIKSLVAQTPDPLLAIVVSEESGDYRDEMNWIGEELNKRGLTTRVVSPEELTLVGDNLYLENGQLKVDVLYRFFELFDLDNIPKIHDIMHAVNRGDVVMTPPAKSYLEEKILFALLHHPALIPFWNRWLSNSTYNLLKRVFPMTWVVDPHPLPPHAVIPGLYSQGRAVMDWKQLAKASQKERELVIKPSGFSELAWGSRGVVVGHDVSSEQWSEALDAASAQYTQTPHIIQRYHKPRKVETSFYDFDRKSVVPMTGRARLCPYYFVEDKGVSLAGILATICPVDKKVIHGMTDAVMMPVAVTVN